MKRSRLFKSFSLLLVFCLSISLFVATPAQAQSLSASPNNIEIGPNKKITVTFSGAPEGDHYSIDLYRVGKTKNLAHQYLVNSKTNGTIEFDAPEIPGTYEFQMRTNDGNRFLARSSPFTVKWMPVKMRVSIGLPDNGKRKLSVQYSRAPGYRFDYICLYKIGDPIKIAFKYLGAKTNGTIELIYPTDTDSYEIQFWSWDTMLARTQAFIPKNGPPPPVDQDPDDPLPTHPSAGDSKITIVLTIGSKNAYVNKKLVVLDAAPKIIQGRTYIPLRFVAEALGCKVEWDGEKMQVTIIYPA